MLWRPVQNGLWNGQKDKTFAHLEALRRWTLAERCPTPEVRKLRRHATDLPNYLSANQDSLPNYGERHREGEPISTAWVESAIDEIIAKRMAKVSKCGGIVGLFGHFWPFAPPYLTTP